MLLEAVDKDAHLEVPKLDAARVERRGEEGQPRVEGDALYAVGLGLELVGGSSRGRGRIVGEGTGEVERGREVERVSWSKRGRKGISKESREERERGVAPL